MSSTSEILSKIWSEEAPWSPGVFTARQVASSINGEPIIFAGLKCETDKPPIRLLLLSIPRSLAIRLGLNKKLDNLVLALLENTNDERLAWLSLSLINPDYESIFLVLCEDLITKVSNIPSDKARLEMFLNRIQVWASLFSHEPRKGLSQEAKRGLFGELQSILALTEDTRSFGKVISAWTGLIGGHQDFRFQNGSLEVKTTKGNGDYIIVENEHQLNLTEVKSLFLIHFLVNEGPADGKSLADIVDEIRMLISDSLDVLSAFNDTLIRSGYLDIHRALYESPLFTVRAVQSYQIQAEFPRLEPSSIPLGVSDACYKVEVSKIQKFSCTLDFVKNQLLK